MERRETTRKGVKESSHERAGLCVRRWRRMLEYTDGKIGTSSGEEIEMEKSCWRGPALEERVRLWGWNE